jgi:hypothetical protein
VRPERVNKWPKSMTDRWWWWLKSSTCFEHYPAHLQEVYVVIVYMQPLAASLCAFLTGGRDSHLQTVTMPEAAYIQLRRRPSEDEQGNARNMYRILINVLYIHINK